MGTNGFLAVDELFKKDQAAKDHEQQRTRGVSLSNGFDKTAVIKRPAKNRSVPPAGHESLGKVYTGNPEQPACP